MILFAKNLCETFNLDYNEIGLIGLAYYLRINNLNDFADNIANYIWAELCNSITGE
jgi:hypothetical protein